MRIPEDIDDAREQLKAMERNNTTRAMGNVFDTIALRIALAEVDRLRAAREPLKDAVVEAASVHVDRPGEDSYRALIGALCALRAAQAPPP